MIRYWITGLAVMIATPAAAQDHSMHDMRGMDHGAMAMPAAPATPAAGDPDCPPAHAAMGHCTPRSAAAKTPPPSPPPVPADHYADHQYDPAAMARARARMMAENGGQRFAMVLFNLAEIGVREGRDALHWNGEGWYGGDIHRLVAKSEGEATIGDRIESAELGLRLRYEIAREFAPYVGISHEARLGRTADYARRAGEDARSTRLVVGIRTWF